MIWSQKHPTPPMMFLPWRKSGCSFFQHCSRGFNMKTLPSLSGCRVNIALVDGEIKYFPIVGRRYRARINALLIAPQIQRQSRNFAKFERHHIYVPVVWCGELYLSTRSPRNEIGRRYRFRRDSCARRSGTERNVFVIRSVGAIKPYHSADPPVFSNICRRDSKRHTLRIRWKMCVNISDQRSLVATEERERRVAIARSV